MATRHVVLVTYGEPPDADFGAQLAYSWRILRGLTRTVAPIPLPLLPLIAVARARSRTRTWRDEAYRSPLESITARQAARLGDALAAQGSGGSWRVHVGYEFRHPLLPDAIGDVPHDEPVWIVPMYATESAFTHGLSRAVVANLRKPRTAPSTVAHALDTHLLAEASAEHVLEHMADDAGWTGPDVALVLAAHGTVLNPPRPIDTGLDATDLLYRAIRSRLAAQFGLVVNGWLNHSRGGRWTEPSVEEALQRVAEAGFRRVVYYPYGFLADNAESQLEGLVALRDRPEFDARRVPCLNDSRRLVDLLANQLAEMTLADARPRTTTQRGA